MANHIAVGRRPLFLPLCRPVRLSTPRQRPFSARARPLSWDIPKPVFPRPETLFPRPERLLGGDNLRDFVLKQEEAVKEFPWEYIIFASILILIVAEIIVRPYDNDTNTEESSDLSESAEEKTSEDLTKKETVRKKLVPLTEEQKKIYALKKIYFQFEQNENLFVLACVTALALWMAGFLNTPHPFFP